ncbi:MAG: hypothetical protein BMS9Abin26_1815 [Gammaproteobacteria bacterium]|nr:MAG: hypothetical protein BMS9Abin26_1815 [Gammaproteobacteria bacterium]
MSKNTANHSNSIYQIKITLRHTKPPIWRRLLVKADIRLGELHDILQEVMGWEFAHLHGFRIGRDTNGEPDPGFPSGIKNERKVYLYKIATEGSSFIYDYDFGDGWEHDIKIEKILPAEPGADYPVCLDGQRACPPEDCGGPHGYAYMLEAFNDPDNGEHEEIVEWLGDNFDAEVFDVDAVNRFMVMETEEAPVSSVLEIPVYEDAVLANYTPAELIDLMIEHEDRVPRNVIDACVSRGEQMLAVLTPVTPMIQPSDELESVNIGHWWLRLHAVMILGLIPGERAGMLLVDLIQGMCREEDENLQEWFAGYWPALLRNKPPPVAASLRKICMDKKADWFMRANITEAIFDQAQQQGEAELEQTLDWAAQLVADEGEDWDYRLSVASDLLDYPRDRHRKLLDDMATRQSGRGFYFDEEDITNAYMRGTDVPKWERFSDPWKFYNDKQIEERQQRWQEEDWEYDIHPDTIDVMGGELGYHYQQPYQHDTKKIGRNEPCPCGSGKKYKKCCIGKVSVM